MTYKEAYEEVHKKLKKCERNRNKVLVHSCDEPVWGYLYALKNKEYHFICPVYFHEKLCGHLITVLSADYLQKNFDCSSGKIKALALHHKKWRARKKNLRRMLNE